MLPPETNNLEITSWCTLSKKFLIMSDIELENELRRIEQFLSSTSRSFLCSSQRFSVADSTMTETILNKKTIIPFLSHCPNIIRWLFTILKM